MYIPGREGLILKFCRHFTSIRDVFSILSFITDSSIRVTFNADLPLQLIQGVLLTGASLKITSKF